MEKVEEKGGGIPCSVKQRQFDKNSSSLLKRVDTICIYFSYYKLVES